MVAERVAESLPAVPQSVPVLRRLVADFARVAGVSGDQLDQLRLAVSEAVTNVVLHAYVEADAPGHVQVTAERDGHLLIVEVDDAGRGMIPRLDSPGLGLGMALMAGATEFLDVQHGPDGGTRVRMAFRLGG